MRSASTHRDVERPSTGGWIRSIAGSTVVTIIVIIVAIACAIAALPARAAPVIPSWNFQLTSGSWVQSGTNVASQILSGSNRWVWTGTATPSPLTGGTSPHWQVLAQGVQPGYSTGYFLTSPVFSGLVDNGFGTLVSASNARISLAHAFLLLTGTSGRPTTLGQLEYQLNGSGTWVGLPTGSFTSGGSALASDVIFGNSPFRAGPTTLQFVNQEAFVAPSYLTPTGTGALQIAAPGALAFSGSTPLWPADYYVPSQAFLNVDTGLPAGGITTLQLRLANINLAGDCGISGWDVRFVQVDFATTTSGVPEPASIAMGMTGLAALTATAACRRRSRHQRPSRPSESP